MAIDTIGGRDIGTFIRQQVADDVEPYEYSDVEINNAITQAVRYYSEMKPYIKAGSFTTVVDQQLYQLPSDALQVTELHYKRTDTDDIYERLSDYYPFGFSSIDSESLTLVQQKLLRAFEEYSHFFWEQITNLTSYRSGRWVILYPPPDNSTDTVNYRYTREHTLASGDYPTIPWEDADTFIELAILAVNEREYARMLRAPARYRDGQTEMDRRASMTEMRRDIENRRQRVQDAFGGVVIR